MIIGLVFFVNNINNLSAAGIPNPGTAGTCDCQLQASGGGFACIFPTQGGAGYNCNAGYYPAGACGAPSGGSCVSGDNCVCVSQNPPPGTCEDECIPGDSFCYDSTQQLVCGNYDGDTCSEWGYQSCGTTSCSQVDSCTGTIYFDYPSYSSSSSGSCSNTCSDGGGGASCNTCSCTAVSETCTAVLADQGQTCGVAQNNCGGGDQERCRMSNSGVLEWVTFLTAGTEANCGDGYDNDCDGLTDGADFDCGGASSVPIAPKLIFRQGSGPANSAVIGSNGVMDIRGTLDDNGFTAAPNGNDFVIKNGAAVVAFLERDTGNLYLQGQVFPSQPSIAQTASAEFVVKSPSGVIVAKFDLSGNLYLTNVLRQSQPNP